MTDALQKKRLEQRQKDIQLKLAYLCSAVAVGGLVVLMFKVRALRKEMLLQLAIEMDSVYDGFGNYLGDAMHPESLQQWFPELYEVISLHVADKTRLAYIQKVAQEALNKE